ncbi:unnamed protein product [Enterobius vermicularis]|uniref:Uncharacterized protein n=1 Tax=Enterobius vermicularis TaxID=51028 RepID=A0A0N4V218_ENTVE|nr:unnamed protein product [Enterobius vermicularis]
MLPLFLYLFSFTANPQLRQVTLAPIRSTFSTPSFNRESVPPTFAYGLPQEPRWGYYYQHYPWDKLPFAFVRRPELHYVYPKAFKNTLYRNPNGGFLGHSRYESLATVVRSRQKFEDKNFVVTQTMITSFTLLVISRLSRDCLFPLSNVFRFYLLIGPIIIALKENCLEYNLYIINIIR